MKRTITIRLAGNFRARFTREQERCDDLMTSFAFIFGPAPRCFAALIDFMNAQRGDNNPWNQDNETTWLNSDLLKHNGDVFRFFRQMIAFRRAHSSPSRSRFWREDVVGTAQPARLAPTLPFAYGASHKSDPDIYVMINSSWEDLNFTVQERKAGDWLCAADRALASPTDFCDAGQEKKVNSLNYNVKARSVVVLLRAH